MSAAARLPERAFLDAALLALALTAVVAVPAAAVLAGTAGALGAAAACAFLVVLLGLSALMHVLTAPFGRQVWLALTLGGLALRVGLYLALILALRDVAVLDGTALGLTAALGIVLGQALEMRALVRARARQQQAVQIPSATRPAAGEGLEGVDR